MRRARSERGAILILAIPILIMAISAAALGVDIGREAVDKRFDQKVADLAALDAARAVDAIMFTSDQAGHNAAAQTEAVASAARNGFVVGTNSRAITATVGHLDQTTGAFTTGTGVFDAVKAVTSSHIDNAFLPGGWDPTAQAVASIPGSVLSTTTTTTGPCTTTTTTYSLTNCPNVSNGCAATPVKCAAIGSFSVGSTLASLDTSKSLLDTALKSMLGTSSSFSAVSYDGIATGNVSMEKLQTQLLALGYNVGSASQLMSTSIRVSDLLKATASALQTQGSNTAAADINDIPLASISSSLTVTLDKLLSVSSPSDESMLAASVNAYQLVVGSAEVANGSNFVSIPLTGVNLLGLSNVSLSAYLIQPATTAIGPVGTVAHNSQAAVKVGVDLTVSGVLAHVTLTYSAADALATLTSLACGASPSMGISALTSGVTVTGTASTLLGSMNINGTVASSSSSALSFNYPAEFAPSFTRHVGQTDTGLSPFASLSVTGSGATAALAPVLQTLLPTTMATLDTAFQSTIRPLLQALGANVAQADIAALGIFPSPTSCGSPVLQ